MMLDPQADLGRRAWLPCRHCYDNAPLYLLDFDVEWVPAGQVLGPSADHPQRDCIRAIPDDPAEAVSIAEGALKHAVRTQRTGPHHNDRYEIIYSSVPFLTMPRSLVMCALSSGSSGRPLAHSTKRKNRGP